MIYNNIQLEFISDTTDENIGYILEIELASLPSTTSPSSELYEIDLHTFVADIFSNPTYDPYLRMLQHLISK